jgi:hypothetical protein
MRIKNSFKLALMIAIAAAPFPVVHQRTMAACTAGESPAPVPLVANGSPYDGYLDVTPCSGTCGGPCYLTTTALQWCQVTGSSESPEGCQPVALPVSGYLGGCNSSPRDPLYRCGCSDFEPQPCSLVAVSAQDCTP